MLLRYSQCLWKHRTYTAKAIADKVDWGSIVLPVTEDDLKSLAPLLETGAIAQPNLVLHIYKNRRSRYSDVKLWCTSDMSTCRVTPVFLTDNNYGIIQLTDYKIKVEGTVNFE